MAFNLGMTRLRKFNKMFSGILQGNFIKASIEMLDSAWAKQVGYRANELSLQMKTGEWS
jgi:lysozyme